MKTTYIDRPEVDEVFADTVHRVTFRDGVLNIELAVTRIDADSPPQEPTATQYTSVRLALSPPAGVQLRDNLDGLLALLEKQGIVKRMVMPPQTTPATAH